MKNYKGFLEKSSVVTRKILNDLENNAPFFISTGPNTDNLIESGATVTMSKGMFDSDIPKVKRVVNLAPNSSVLIKKKAKMQQYIL